METTENRYFLCLDCNLPLGSPDIAWEHLKKYQHQNVKEFVTIKEEPEAEPMPYILF